LSSSAQRHRKEWLGKKNQDLCKMEEKFQKAWKQWKHQSRYQQSSIKEAAENNDNQSNSSINETQDSSTN